MAAQAQQDTAKPGGTIASFYQRDPKRSVPALSGGWPAFAVTDRRDPARPLMALPMRPGFPPRANVLATPADAPMRNLMMPIADGPGLDTAGQPGWFMVCPAPPGPALDLAAGPWREQELINCVLVPAAAALASLEERGLTHRAIRPDNLFRVGAGQPVTLGPFWAAPPGTGQPTVADPPFLAWCRTACQGEGSIADDVYALGVTLLALASGRMPLAGVDAADILRRHLSMGSFATLTAGSPGLPTLLGDLLRGMLAEDPDHRPSPALLADPPRAAARRTTTRPPRRAAKPLDVGTQAAWTARELAHALATQPDPGWTLLHDGSVDRWLRRFLSDPTLAARVEEVRARHDDDAEGPTLAAAQLMRAVAVLEPLAPLVWKSESLWPDGLGTALAAAEPKAAAVLQDMVQQDVVSQWAASHPRRTDAVAIRQLSNEWKALLNIRGVCGGLRRLTYALNPMLACASPLLLGRPVPRLADLLHALEAASTRADRRRPPIDAEIAAFIAARVDPSQRADVAGLQGLAGETERPIMLRLFARLQMRFETGPLPGLAAWLHESGLTGIARWRCRSTRLTLARRVATLVAAGDLAPLLGAVEDTTAFASDSAGAADAAARVVILEDRLRGSELHASRRLEEARKLAYDIAAGTGLLAMLGATLRLAFG